MRITTATASSLFINTVQKAVYSKELELINRYVENLFKAYRAEGNHEIAGFIYLGTEYRYYSAGRLISLPAKYKEEVNSIFKSNKEVLTVEQPKSHHYFCQLLRETKNLESLRLILPPELYKYAVHYLDIFDDDKTLSDERVKHFADHEVMQNIKFKLAFQTVL